MKSKWLVLGMGLLLVFRLWLTTQSKHGDMYNNLDWGRGAVTFGLAGFYELPKEVWDHSRPNQPPGSIYFHAASALIDQSVGDLIWQLNLKFPLFPSPLVWWWPTYGNLLAIKLFSVIADFALAGALYSLGKHFKQKKLGLTIAFVYLLNPAMWYNSAYWGQTDAIVATMALWSITFLFKKRLVLSSLLLGLSLITKASWTPIVPLYVLYYWVNHREKLGFLLVTPLTMIIASIPFHPAWDLPIWLTNLFITRILPGESAYITVIAFNFWNLMFSPDFVPQTVSFWGFPANQVGLGIVLVGLLILAYRWLKKPTPAHWLWVSSLLFFVVFLFAPKIIHRYLYPFFPLFLASLVSVKHKLNLWLVYGILSTCYLINLYYKWWSPGNIWLQSGYSDFNTKIVSGVYLLIFAFLFMLNIRHEFKD